MITISWKDHCGNPCWQQLEDHQTEEANMLYSFLLVEMTPGLECQRPDGTKIKPTASDKFATNIIEANFIKPSEFIKMTTGLQANEFLPEEEPTYKTSESGRKHRFNPEKATKKQQDFLRQVGINQTEGLTIRQAQRIIALVLERDRKNLAKPWMLKVLRDLSPKSWSAFKCMVYANVTKEIAFEAFYTQSLRGVGT